MMGCGWCSRARQQATRAVTPAKHNPRVSLLTRMTEHRAAPCSQGPQRAHRACGAGRCTACRRIHHFGPPPSENRAWALPLIPKTQHGTLLNFPIAPNASHALCQRGKWLIRLMKISLMQVSDNLGKAWGVRSGRRFSLFLPTKLSTGCEFGCKAHESSTYGPILARRIGFAP